MALREIRVNFYSGEDGIGEVLTKEVALPFTWYMDSLMRGRFKEYSGSEVKGINIVNLNLSTDAFYQVMQTRSGGKMQEGWVNILNTYELDTAIDMSVFEGNQTDKILKVIEVFIVQARLSDLPQVKKLIQHLEASIGVQSIDDAIIKANDYLDRLYGNASK
jgi:hypothetical protein